MILHWDGPLWQVIAVPNLGKENWLNDIQALSADDIWAVGGVRQDGHWVGLALHFDGTEWREVELPLPADAIEINLTKVSAIDKNNVWAAGNALYHWDGSTWKIARTDAASVTALSPDDVWMTDKIEFWHWDGTEWAQIAEAQGKYPSWVNDLEAIAPDDIYAVGSIRSDALFTSEALVQH